MKDWKCQFSLLNESGTQPHEQLLYDKLKGGGSFKTCFTVQARERWRW